MSKLLYVEASPRKARSASIAVAQAFLKEYGSLHPKDALITLDLWKKELPAFNGETIDAKYAIMHGKAHSQEQAEAWKSVQKTIAEFKSADKYVFSLPMWNFSIPYVLKHYIDVLVQPGETFTYSPEEGYKGLVLNKPVVLIYARGGAYGAGSGGEALDLQKQYMETVLGFIGFKDFHSILIEPTLGNEDQKELLLKKATEEARKLAAKI